jgi:hypothetical protein
MIDYANEGEHTAGGQEMGIVPYDRRNYRRRARSTKYSQRLNTISRIGPQTLSPSQQRVTHIPCIGTKPCNNQTKRNSSRQRLLIAEVKSHVDNQHFVLMWRAKVPEGTRVLAAV